MIKYVDIPKNLCNHVIGDNHTHKHRLICGTIIIMIGVGIVKGAMFFEGVAVHFIAESVGFLIHGIGSIPYIELISKIGKDTNDVT